MVRFTTKSGDYDKEWCHADSEEEAKQEFYAALEGVECCNEANSWIDQYTIYDVEWNGEILDVSEC